MKVLITGATGLIGKAVITGLLQRGHSVNFLTTSRSKLSSIPGCFGYFWDPVQSYIDENALIGVEAIIHLAGEPISKRWTDEQKEKIVESRVLTANLLLHTLKRNPHQVRQVISASGIGIYPNSVSEVYTEESKSSDDSFLANVVQKWEQSIAHFCNMGIATCIIRTGLVLSDKGGALPELQKTVKIGLASALGTGRQIYSWIHIDDLAGIYVHAIEQQLQGIFNAVAPNPVANEVFMKQLAESSDKPFFMPAVPALILKLMLGEMHLLLVTGQNVSSEKIIRSGFQFKFPELRMALDDLINEKAPIVQG